MATLMDLNAEENRGSVEEPSYSEVLQNTNKVDSKPVRLKEADLFGSAKPTNEQWLNNVEIFKSPSAEVPVETILEIQRVGSLWRLYIEDDLDFDGEKIFYFFLNLV